MNNMELIDREALSMELANEVLCPYCGAKMDGDNNGK